MHSLDASDSSTCKGGNNVEGAAESQGRCQRSGARAVLEEHGPA